MSRGTPIPRNADNDYSDEQARIRRDFIKAQTGAALMPVVSHFDGTGWRHTVHAEVDVPGPGRLRDRVHAGMQGVADSFALSIAQRPVDWHQLGRIWADVVPGPPR